MKDKLKFLTKQSLDKKIKTKWFKGVNILLLVLLIAISNIDRIVTFFGGDFEDNITIYVKDDIESFNLFETTFTSLATNLGDSKNYQVEMLSNNIEEEKGSLKKDDNKVLVDRVLFDQWCDSSEQLKIEKSNFVLPKVRSSHWDER